MNDATFLLLDVFVTLLACVLVVGYLGPSLFRILVDLCGTADRARFWLTFARILLVGFPVVMALSYQSGVAAGMAWYLTLAQELGRTMMTLLMTVAGLGLVIIFFAAIAPRQPKESRL